MIRRAQGVSRENESQMVARSLGAASAGPEKRIPVREKGQMDVTPEMKRVYGEMAPNATKSFGDEWVREAASDRQWVAEISRRHPTDSIVEPVRRGPKPKASDQRHQGHAG